MGAAAASIMGTVGASKAMIHPLLRANAGRRRKMHRFVFFILLAGDAVAA